ncbi:tetraacyldisaccharide 4'-kinase [Nonlabens spongiae]|uniref:Tetraacyldisaccharide 4'-kinase n=1 Tax=Nonlabens spongiae TaxID=331648 RepID=A0A1W6MKB4_9FLAO|nr:tetraacyldisaccharide 4'-kinase [Nonlabens spongiae]ARN78035.1 tetraacyldisaccharide 4'-kinase [Nonlabens spongiae]
MRKLRLLLYPFAVLYDLITALRNFFFNVGLTKQYRPKVFTVAVGNLSTGGTGKTPMIEYLIRSITDKKVGVVSRGYGRSTRGYLEVETSHTPKEVGDEPLQIKTKFADSIKVAVAEKRVLGIKNLSERYDLDVILLDDAYQHRHVKAHKYILLTSYDRPYYQDFVLPAGDLRESAAGVTRADHIIVTKCPSNLSVGEQNKIRKKIKPRSYQTVDFAYIGYSNVLQGDEKLPLEGLKQKKVTLVTGIAKPQPLVDHLSQFLEVDHLKFPDHHNFTDQDIEKIRKMNFIITTEKDYMRLKKFGIPNLYFIEIETKFLGEEDLDFTNIK